MQWPKPQCRDVATIAKVKTAAKAEADATSKVTVDAATTAKVEAAAKVEAT